MPPNGPRKKNDRTGSADRADDRDPQPETGSATAPDGDRRLPTEEWRARFACNLDRLLRLIGLGRKEAAAEIGIDYPLLRRLVTTGLSRTENRRADDLVKIAAYFTLTKVDDLWRFDLIYTVLDPQLGQGFVNKFRSRLIEERGRRLAEPPPSAADELALLSRALGFPSPSPTSLKDPEAYKLAVILRSRKGDTFRQLIEDYYELVTKKPGRQGRKD